MRAGSPISARITCSFYRMFIEVDGLQKILSGDRSAYKTELLDNFTWKEEWNKYSNPIPPSVVLYLTSALESYQEENRNHKS